jgi:hypothetical protein
MLMTYDPDRDSRAPADVSPNTRPYERDRPDLSVIAMLGIMAAFIGFGLWFYMTGGEHSVAHDDRPAVTGTTTGSGTREAPLPNTPTPPTVPSPARE